jgi:hypothetical protein
MKKGKTPAWFALWIDKWLFGSTRNELVIRDGDLFLDLRGIFMDLLALSKKDEGFIRANETTPYPLPQLAGMFNVPIDSLKRTIDICLNVGKLTEPTSGIYYISSTQDYDLSERWKRSIHQKSLFPEATSENAEVTSAKADLLIRRDKIIKEDIKEESDVGSSDILLVNLLIDLMLKNNPESSIIRRLTEKRRKEWINCARLLRERDGKTEQEIEFRIRFSQNDEFWKTNILSMPKLREKWDQLFLASQRTKNGYSWDKSKTIGKNIRPKSKKEQDLARWIAEETKRRGSRPSPEEINKFGES